MAMAPWSSRGTAPSGRPSPSVDEGSVSVLNTVSCTTRSFCVAVGDYYGTGSFTKTLIERWNGTVWSVLRSPSIAGGDNSLNGVDCATANTCEAVGRHDAETLVESWNGRAWSVAPSPKLTVGESSLNAVSCVSARSCTAVGNYGSRTLVESWNGRSWTVVPSPTPGTYGGLSGVSCSAVGSCMAVGDVGLGTGSGTSTPPQALTESWNGSAWSSVKNPSPGGAQLYSVSCVTARSCKAVGDAATGSGTTRLMVESWSGSAWSVVTTESPPVAYLYGVACVATTSCLAVGEYARNTSGAAPIEALVEIWSGGK